LIVNNKKRDINQELIDGLQDIEAYKRGEIELRTFTVAVKKVAPPLEIRKRLNLSQHSFALRLGVSVRTLQAWEQGRRTPSGPALALLRIADQEPDVFLRVR
jgi:putative transcriptional regulator